MFGKHKRRDVVANVIAVVHCKCGAHSRSFHSGTQAMGLRDEWWERHIGKKRKGKK